MNQREHTLDHLTEGIDIADYKDEARAFLSVLMELTPDEAAGTVVPVARRLLAYPDWRDTMTPLSVLDFCLPRRAAVVALGPLRTVEYDPESEYLTGIVECYRDAIGRSTLLACRPDLCVVSDGSDDRLDKLSRQGQSEPATPEVDYLAITRSFG